MSVHSYITTVQDSKKREILVFIRTLILPLDDRLTEGIKYGVPFYWLNKNIVYLSPKGPGINLGFVQGVKLENDYGLLTGNGKQVRHIYIPDITFLTRNDEAIRATIYQAIDLDLEMAKP